LGKDPEKSREGERSAFQNGLYHRAEGEELDSPRKCTRAKGGKSESAYY